MLHTYGIYSSFFVKFYGTIIYEISKVIFMKFLVWLLYKTALHIAIEKGNRKIVKLLLENESIDVNIKSKAEHKRKFLKEKVANIIILVEQKTGLHLAIEKAEKEIVDILLLNRNIDANMNYQSEKRSHFFQDFQIRRMKYDISPIHFFI